MYFPATAIKNAYFNNTLIGLVVMDGEGDGAWERRIVATRADQVGTMTRCI
jgi:hypothetical protein